MARQGKARAASQETANMAEVRLASAMLCFSCSVILSVSVHSL